MFPGLSIKSQTQFFRQSRRVCGLYHYHYYYYYYDVGYIIIIDIILYQYSFGFEALGLSKPMEKYQAKK
jgi:hypothetical protein